MYDSVNREAVGRPERVSVARSAGTPVARPVVPEFERIRREHEEQLARKEELVNQYRYRPTVASDIAPKNEYAYPATLDMIKDVEPERPSFVTGVAKPRSKERIVVGRNVSRSQTEYEFRLESSVRAREQQLSMSKTNDPLQTYR